MPGGRPRVLTADQIERATLLRTVGLSIADCAAEVRANRETLREQFLRDGTVPRPQPDFSKPDALTSRDLPPTSTRADDVDVGGFPAHIPDVSMANAPAADSRQDGWAVDHIMSEVLARRHPSARLVQPMTEADHREFGSPAGEGYPSNRRDLNG